MSDVSAAVPGQVIPIAPGTPPQPIPVAAPAAVPPVAIVPPPLVDDLSIPTGPLSNTARDAVLGDPPKPTISAGIREVAAAIGADVSKLKPSAVLAETGLGHISTEAHTILMAVLAKLRAGEQVIVTSAEDLIGKRMAVPAGTTSILSAHPWLLGVSHAVVGTIGAVMAALLHL